MDYPNWINNAEELYKLKYSFTLIGEELGVDRKLVSYYLQKKGYKPNHKFLPKTQIVQKTKKYIDEDVFEKINTEEKAYWLGFLMADGSVSEKRNTIELALKEEDFEHLKKYKKFLKSEHAITKKIKDNKYVSYRLSFNSKKIKNDLIKNGCVPNKTTILKFPKIKKSLTRHFIRGYLDGDGCITKSKTSKVSIEILGTENFVKSIADFYNIEGHIYKFNHSEIKRFMIAGKKAKIILDNLYNNSNIYLERKYNTYKNFAVLFQSSQKE